MRNSYQEITDIITSNSESLIWHKPWFTRGGFKKHSNGQSYSLLNTLLLIAQGEKGGEYIGYKSAIAAGGHVKKGEKGKSVYFWKILNCKQDDDDLENSKPKLIPYLQSCTIFNVETQCEGVELKYPEKEFLHTGIEAADKVAQDYILREGIKFKQDPLCGSAFFRQSEDLIQVPPLNCYECEAEYYSTLYHELTHSTGIEKRLNRFGTEINIAANDKTDYSREELVAELGSVFALNNLKINVQQAFNNSIAYIKEWNKKLKSDPKMIVWAAAKAEAAVDFIFNIQKQTETEE